MYYELTNIELFYSLLGIFFIAFICYKIKESKHWINRKIFQSGSPQISDADYTIQKRNHIHTHRYGMFMIAWLVAFVSGLSFGITWDALLFGLTCSAMYMSLDLLLNLKMHNYDSDWGIWHLGDEFWDRFAPWPVRFLLLAGSIYTFHFIQ